MSGSNTTPSIYDVLVAIRDGGGAGGGGSSGLTDAQLRAAAIAVTGIADVTVNGPAALSAANTDLITGNVNGWYDAGLFRTAVVQVIASAGISAGAVIFEQTNDITLAPAGAPVVAVELSLNNPGILLATNNIAASATRIFGVSLMARYFRVRIATAFVGGTVRASTVFSQDVYASPMINMQQATAANLQVQANLSTGSSLVGDVGVQVRATAGGIVSNSRLPTSAATTNGNIVKNTAGRVYKIRGFNAAAAARYLKFYNSATVTVGTTAVTDTFALPAGAVFDIDFGSIGKFYSTGICFSLTTGAADADATAVALGDILGLNIYYA